MSGRGRALGTVPGLAGGTTPTAATAATVATTLTAATVDAQALDAPAALRLAGDSLDRRPLLVVTDFDGTIARIAMDPWAAAILPGAQRALRRLAGSPGVHVALLSGRTALDLAERARIGGATYLGNHGLERSTLPRGTRAESLRVAPDLAFTHFVEHSKRLADGVPTLVAEPWLVVERKGPAVAFHFRSAPDLPAAAARVAAAVDEVDSDRRFERFAGRRVLELRPPGAATKGAAFRDLLAEMRPATALVLGDDRSDAEAFAVLREARQTGSVSGVALAVHAHAELPPGVAASADAILASPADAALFLAGVARRVGSIGRGPACPCRGPRGSGQPGPRLALVGTGGQRVEAR